MCWIPKDNELTTCPYCGAEQLPDLPYPGLHAFTLLYECGTDLTVLIGYDGQCVTEKRCDED